MRGKKKDYNQGEIVEALEKMGALVMDLADVGGGCPDLLVCYRGTSFFVEVKNPKTSYGKKGLNHLQARLVSKGWPVFIAKTIEDVPTILRGVIA